jgi:SAM-dependent methyltransferase
MSGHETGDPLLAEQQAYYGAIASDYESLALEGWGGPEVAAALTAFAPTGDVLELACGPGMWTEILLRHATSVTAIDGSREMLARARARAGNQRARFLQADLFSWRPERRYDVVFFGFWLSHVPLDRVEAFWSLVDDCLTPTGRVFFADEAHRPPEELIEGDGSTTIERRTPGGARYRIVKVPYRPRELEAQLAALGWRFSITQTSGHFFWGAGSRQRPV